MAQTPRIIETVKAMLKQQGMTYRVLAARLNLSESAVKQMFASGDMNLSRLDQICQVLSMDISDLLQEMQSTQQRLQSLTFAQEKKLVGNPRLLVMAYCVLNRWTFEQITDFFDISEPDGIKLLVELDRMQFIELLPGNRTKLLVASNFDWLPNGPIETYFEKEAQGPFFDSNFDEDGCMRLVKSGDLSDAGRQSLCERITSLGQHFDGLMMEEQKVPLDERSGTTMVLAIRHWEFAAFANLKRQPAQKKVN